MHLAVPRGWVPAAHGEHFQTLKGLQEQSRMRWLSFLGTPDRDPLPHSPSSPTFQSRFWGCRGHNGRSRLPGRMYSGGVQSMGSISNPFFRFPLSEGPEAGGQPEASCLPASMWPWCACLGPNLPNRKAWPLASSPAPGPLAPWPSAQFPSPNASGTSQVAISEDTQKGQGVAVNPIEGIRWVQTLEQVSDMAHMDSSLPHRVGFWQEGRGRWFTTALTRNNPPSSEKSLQRCYESGVFVLAVLGMELRVCAY